MANNSELSFIKKTNTPIKVKKSDVTKTLNDAQTYKNATTSNVVKLTQAGVQSAKKAAKSSFVAKSIAKDVMDAGTMKNDSGTTMTLDQAYSKASENLKKDADALGTDVVTTAAVKRNTIGENKPGTVAYERANDTYQNYLTYGQQQKQTQDKWTKSGVSSDATDEDITSKIAELTEEKSTYDWQVAHGYEHASQNGRMGRKLTLDEMSAAKEKQKELEDNIAFLREQLDSRANTKEQNADLDFQNNIVKNYNLDENSKDYGANLSSAQEQITAERDAAQVKVDEAYAALDEASQVIYRKHGTASKEEQDAYYKARQDYETAKNAYGRKVDYLNKQLDYVSTKNTEYTDGGYNAYREESDYDVMSQYFDDTLSESEFAKSPAMIQQYGSYENYKTIHEDTKKNDGVIAQVIYAINGNDDALGRLSEIGDVKIQTEKSEDLPGTEMLEHMTASEVKMATYLYNTQGEEAVTDYLHYLEPKLNEREMNQVVERNTEFANDHPVAASVLSVAEAPIKGLSYVGQAAEYAATGSVDINAPYNRISRGQNAIRDEVSRQVESAWGEPGTFLYQTGMSMGDFLMTTLVTGGTLGNRAFNLALMGAGAAADATIDAKQRGLSDNQAFTLGTIAGAAEIITEKVSVDYLFATVGRAASGFGKPVLYELLTNTFAEGAEEVGADFINLFADILVAKDESKWKQSIASYMNQGMSEREAFSKAVADQAKTMGLDFLGGAISGGVMAGGHIVMFKSEESMTRRAVEDAVGQNLSTDAIQVVSNTLFNAPVESKEYKSAREILNAFIQADSIKDAKEKASAIAEAQERAEAQVKKFVKSGYGTNSVKAGIRHEDSTMTESQSNGYHTLYDYGINANLAYQLSTTVGDLLSGKVNTVSDELMTSLHLKSGKTQDLSIALAISQATGIDIDTSSDTTIKASLQKVADAAKADRRFAENSFRKTTAEEANTETAEGEAALAQARSAREATQQQQAASSFAQAITQLAAQNGRRDAGPVNVMREEPAGNFQPVSPSTNVKSNTAEGKADEVAVLSSGLVEAQAQLKAATTPEAKAQAQARVDELTVKLEEAKKKINSANFKRESHLGSGTVDKKNVKKTKLNAGAKQVVQQHQEEKTDTTGTAESLIEAAENTEEPKESTSNAPLAIRGPESVTETRKAQTSQTEAVKNNDATADIEKLVNSMIRSYRNAYGNITLSQEITRRFAETLVQGMAVSDYNKQTKVYLAATPYEMRKYGIGSQADGEYNQELNAIVINLNYAKSTRDIIALALGHEFKHVVEERTNAYGRHKNSAGAKFNEAIFNVFKNNPELLNSLPSNLRVFFDDNGKVRKDAVTNYRKDQARSYVQEDFDAENLEHATEFDENGNPTKYEDGYIEKSFDTIPEQQVEDTIMAKLQELMETREDFTKNAIRQEMSADVFGWMMADSRTNLLHTILRQFTKPETNVLEKAKENLSKWSKERALAALPDSTGSFMADIQIDRVKQYRQWVRDADKDIKALVDTLNKALAAEPAKDTVEGKLANKVEKPKTKRTPKAKTESKTEAAPKTESKSTIQPKMSAVERKQETGLNSVLRSVGKSMPTEYKTTWIGKDGKQYVCDGYRIYSLDKPIDSVQTFEGERKVERIVADHTAGEEVHIPETSAINKAIAAAKASGDVSVPYAIDGESYLIARHSGRGAQLDFAIWSPGMNFLYNAKYIKDINNIYPDGKTYLGISKDGKADNTLVTESKYGKGITLGIKTKTEQLAELNRLSGNTATETRNHIHTSSLTESQLKNYNFNQGQKEVGSGLKTLGGSDIKRYLNTVGKNLGSNLKPEVYFNRLYANDIVPQEIINQAEQVMIDNGYDLSQFKCAYWSKDKNVYRFDEAPDFDTAREPIPGRQVTVDLNTNKITRDKVSTDIWHHKWLWVENDYQERNPDGFNVADSWNWSKTYLSTITPVDSNEHIFSNNKGKGSFAQRGIADAGIWDEQLDYFNLPHDENRTRFSMHKVDPYKSSDESKWTPGHSEDWFRQNGFNIREDVSEEWLNARKTRGWTEGHKDYADKGFEGTSKKVGTQINGTKSTYEQLFDALKERFPDTWQNLRVLDASSGLGLGTKAGLLAGFDVTDIEPYVSPDSDYMPDYMDYSSLENKVLRGEVKPFDFIISNAVLNVIPQDSRDNMVHWFSNVLADGGMMYVNTLNQDYTKNVTANIERDKNGEITGKVLTQAGDYTSKTKRGNEVYAAGSQSVQKGFSNEELKAYLQDSLGSEYTVSVNADLSKSDKALLKPGSGAKVLVVKNANTTRNRVHTSSLTESQLAAYEPDAVIGLEMHQDDKQLIDLILSGKKTIETRKALIRKIEDALKAGQNPRIGIVNLDLPGKPIVAYATVTESKKYEGVGAAKAFQQDYEQHQVANDDTYGIENSRKSAKNPEGRKIGYRLTDVKALTEDQYIPTENEAPWQSGTRKITEENAAVDKARNRMHQVQKEALDFGSAFSGAATIEVALRGIVENTFAVEYDPLIAAIGAVNTDSKAVIDIDQIGKRNNRANGIITEKTANKKGIIVSTVYNPEIHGRPYFISDIRKIDLTGYTIDHGHISPVCHNFSGAKTDAEETELDISTAKAGIAKLIAAGARTITVENAPAYKNSESIRHIKEALDLAGYTYDDDVYSASDYGGNTIRKRYFLRATKVGKLPPMPYKVLNADTSWGSVVNDLIDVNAEDIGMPKWMQERWAEDENLKNIKPSEIKDDMLIIGGNKGFGLTYSYAYEPSKTILANSADARIVLSAKHGAEYAGKVIEATPKMLARIQGLPDSFVLPKERTEAIKVIGNGVPTQLTQAVLGSLLEPTLQDNGIKMPIYNNINQAYLEAVSNGDDERAAELFNKYVLNQADEGITPFTYAESYRTANHAVIANALKVADEDAINNAASEMATRVPKNAVLVPMPSHFGMATDTLALANAISEITGAPVMDILKGPTRDSVHDRKSKGKTISPDMLGLYAEDEIPEGKQAIIIDNVVGTGTSGAAAVRALGQGVVLSYAYGKQSKNLQYLKLADPVTYDDNGKVIPLTERFNKNNPDIRYSVAHNMSYSMDELRAEENRLLSRYENAESIDNAITTVREALESITPDEVKHYPKLFKKDQKTLQETMTTLNDLWRTVHMPNAPTESEAYMTNGRIKNAVALASLTSSSVERSHERLSSGLKGTGRYSVSHNLTKQDAEYEKALAENDTDKLQSIIDEAAKAAGYTIKAYHGTGETFTVFDKSKQGTNYGGWLEFGAGFYFTPNKKSAEMWASNGERINGNTIINAYLKPDKMLSVDEPFWTPGIDKMMRDKGYIQGDINYATMHAYRVINTLHDYLGYSYQDIQKEFISAGYNMLDASEHNGEKGQYIVFNSAAIKSADPITYDDDGNVIMPSERFNSNKSDIRFSRHRPEHATDPYEVNYQFRGSHNENSIPHYTRTTVDTATNDQDRDDFNQVKDALEQQAKQTRADVIYSDFVNNPQDISDTILDYMYKTMAQKNLEPSQVFTNTLQQARYLNNREKHSSYLLEASKTVRQTNKESVAIALNRFNDAINRNGGDQLRGNQEVWNDLMNTPSENWTAPDVDAAFTLFFMAKEAARVSGDYTKVIEMERKLSNVATNSGRVVQSFAKYSDSAEGILVNAIKHIEETRLESEDRKTLLQGVADFVDMVSMTQDGDKDAMIKLLVDAGKFRGNKLSAADIERLKTQDFHWLKSVTLHQVNRFVGDYMKTDLAKKVNTIHNFGLLANFHTWAVNNISNGTMSLLDQGLLFGAQNYAAIADAVLSKLTGQDTRILYRQTLDARKAGRNEARERAFRAKIKSSLDLNGEDFETDLTSGAKDNFKYYANKGNTFKSSDAYAFNRWMAGAEKTLSHELLDADERAKGRVAGAMRAMFNAHNLIAPAGTSVEDAHNNGQMTQDEAEDIIRRRELFDTFQNNSIPGTVFRQVKDILNIVGFGDTGRKIGDYTVHEFGIGDFLIKYTQVAGALLQTSIEFSPMGYFKSAFLLAKAAHNGGFKNIGVADRFNVAMSIGRATKGTGLLILAWIMAKLGIIGLGAGEDDDNVNAEERSEGISGSFINLSKLGRLLAQKDSLADSWDTTNIPQDGDVTVEFGNIQPLNALVGYGIRLERMDTPTGAFDLGGKILQTVIETAWETITDMSMMTSISSAYNAFRYSDNEDFGGKVGDAAISLATTAVTSFIPTMVRQTARATDQNYRDVYGGDSTESALGRNISNSIPLLRQQLPTKLTNFGEDKTYNTGTVGQIANAANAFISPVNVNIVHKNTYAQELANVYAATGNADIYPDRAAPKTKSASVLVKDENGELTKQSESVEISLTEEQRRQYQTTRGNVTMQILDSVFASDIYKDGTPEKKAELISGAVSYGDYAAKAELFTNAGYTFSSANKTTTALKLGIDYMTYNTVYDEIDACSGETKQEDIIAIINGYDLTDEQKDWLFTKVGGYGEKSLSKCPWNK